MKLGSLFDGSGGFPLAGTVCGIEPVWASEIEPYPLKVTAARFPHMIQLGDVTKINGAEIEPVDVITFGSPCQDLSVAGKQAGIHDGERSNLFFEAIRIIKEMRTNDRAAGRADEHCRPRFAVWENVPGAFSSNKGADFQAVLQALCEVTDTSASVPLPEKGKWQKAGCIVGDGYSIAWRVYDAQFWGVPQRRKRIYLIADFASERAGEILFERESMCRDTAQGGKEGQRTADDAEGSIGRSCAAGFIGRQGSLAGSVGFDPGLAPTLRSSITVDCVYAIDQQGGKGTANFAENLMPTICADSHGTPHGIVFSIEGNTVDRLCNKNGKGWCEGVSPTLNTQDRHAVLFRHVKDGVSKNDGTSGTLRARMPRDRQDIVCYPERTGALCANSHPGSYTGQDAFNDMLPVIKTDKPPRKYIVRRLTPLECCRLQGFPDWWEDGVEVSDSARYKM